jgi:hypothetical protein
MCYIEVDDSPALNKPVWVVYMTALKKLHCVRRPLSSNTAAYNRLH